MAEETPTHFRSRDELTPEERAELDRALDSGVTELRPAHPKGLLGEKGMDVRKVDEVDGGIDGGVLQENDPGVRALWIVLAFLIFFPVGYVMLWRADFLSRRTKVITSWVVAVIIGLLVLKFSRG